MQNFILEAQTNYAHDILDFKYLMSVTETDQPKEDLKAFVSFETLTIKPYEDTLMFEGKLLDLYGNADKKTRADLKKSNDRGLLNKTMAEHMSKQLSEKLSDEELDNIFGKIYDLVEEEIEEDEEPKLISIEECENLTVKSIYEYIENFSSDLEIIDDEDYYVVGAEMENVTFSNRDLTKLYLESSKTQAFYIVPTYNQEDEEDEKSYGVRFCWEIKK